MNCTFTRPTILFSLLLLALSSAAQVKYSNASPSPFPDLVAGATNNQFFSGDFDNDGDYDLVFWNGSLDHYYKNNGNGTFTLISNNAQTPFPGLRMPVFGQENTVMQDFDSDGDEDILYFDNLLNFHIYLQNNGTGYVQGANPFANFVAGSNMSSATVNQFLPGDFDNDGDVDMLYSTGSINKYYQNNGAGTFTHYDDLTNTPFTILPTTSIPTKGLQYLVKADFDTDNDLDLYYFNPLTGVHHYLQNNNGVYSDVVSPFPAVIDGVNGGSGTANKFQAGDFDADGDVDFVFWTPTVNQYYANNGAGVFTFFPDYMNTPFEGVNGPTYGLHQSQITDIDNDGDIDIVSNEGPTYTILILNGAPPVVQSFDPVNEALNVAVNKNLSFQFSSVVNSGGGNIYLAKASDNSIVETIPASASNVTGLGTNDITINPTADLLPGVEYNLFFDYNAFKDPLGRVFGELDLEWRRTSDIFYTTYYSFTTALAVLPIKLKSFQAKRELDGVKLYWETAMEVNAREMVVERSSNGNIFTAIGSVSAKGKPTAYNFFDPSLTNSSKYYRLKMVDLDGSFLYSNIVRINESLDFTSLSVYPNPVRSGNLLTVQSTFKEGNIKIMGLNGSVLFDQVWKAGELLNTQGLAAGMYIMQVESNGKSERLKLVVY